jgi:nitrite reductase (NADH) small subunit
MTAVRAPGREHRLGRLADLPVGEGRAYAVGGEQVAVFRLRDGHLRATQASCPHRGGPLADGLIDDRVVVCPLHARVFDLDTGCSADDEAPLSTYPVRVDDDGVVTLTLPERGGGPAVPP